MHCRVSPSACASSSHASSDVSTARSILAASQTLFGIFELVENIIVHLPHPQLVACSRVARLWHTITKESPRVRRLIYGPHAPLDKTQPWIGDGSDCKIPVPLYEVKLDFTPFVKNQFDISKIRFKKTNCCLTMHELTLWASEGSRDKKFLTGGLDQFATTPPVQALAIEARLGSHGDVTDKDFACFIFVRGGIRVKDIFEVADAMGRCNVRYGSEASGHGYEYVMVSADVVNKTSGKEFEEVDAEDEERCDVYMRHTYFDTAPHGADDSHARKRVKLGSSAESVQG